MINLEVPVKDMDLTNLKAGDVISLTGNILTARDQAHKRILEQGAPCDIEGAAIFHAGPIITNKGSEDEPEYEIVAVGPTTSMRMNPYQKDVIALGPKIVIGKGGMDDTVREALKEHGMDDTVREALKEHNAIYVVATGGCAALYVDAVEKIESVDWLDLGMPEAMWNLKVNSALYVDAVEKIESVDWLDLGMPEAMWNLKVDSFGPLIVAMDSHGNSLYD